MFQSVQKSCEKGKWGLIPSWSRLNCQVHLSRRKIRPTSTGTKIIESGLLPDSRYEHDWLSHRFFHNLKSHSNGLDCKTRPFAEVHGSHIQDWTKLEILPFFVDLPRKIAAVTIFRTLRFFITFLFFSLTSWGFWSPQNNSAKIAKNRDCNYLWYFTIFRYSFAFLTYQAGFRIQQILRKKKKGKKSRTQRFFPLNDFSLYFVFLTYQTALPNWTNSAKIEKIVVALYDVSLLLCCYHLQRGFPNSPIPRKVEKIVPIPPFNIFPYVFIT